MQKLYDVQNVTFFLFKMKYEETLKAVKILKWNSLMSKIVINVTTIKLMQ